MDIKNHGVIANEKQEGVLYNGIKLPDIWPPRSVDPLTEEPYRVPYLIDESEGGHRPRVIDITVGRQLFVDDFLIERTELETVYHQPKKYEGNPVMKPETPEELLKDFGVGLSAGALWYDMEDQKYKLWYDIAFNWGLGYAESEDGINWKRVPCSARGDSVIFDNKTKDGTCMVFIDYAADKSEKYKMFMQSFLNHVNNVEGHHDVPINSNDDNNYVHTLFVSADGINWTQKGGLSDCASGDASSAYYDALRKKWVNSIRTYCNTWYAGRERKGRVRYFADHDDFEDLLHWRAEDAVFWLKCDKDDPIDPASGYAPQMYNLNAIAYESIMYGGWQIWRGPENGECVKTGNPKITEIMASFSRDGFYYDRPCRVPFIPAVRTDGSWDKGYLFAPPASMIVYDDEIRFYYSAFSGYKGKVKDAHGSQQIGFATLRRDGFASMEGKGELLSRTLTVNKSVKYLFVNIDAPRDSVVAEITDSNGKPIEGFSMSDCVAVGGDTCKVAIMWKSGKTLDSLKGGEFRIRFCMKECGKLYSFWLSGSEDGESGGAVGAGYVRTQ